MRLLIVLTAIFLTTCSKSHDVALKSMKEFHFPYDELRKQKSFVYQKVGGTEQAVISQQIIEKRGTRFFISVAGNESIKFDSSITSLGEPPKLMSIFRYEYDTLGNFQGFTEGSIKKEEYFSNGTPYGGRKSYIKYERNKIETEYRTIDNFRRDTIYYWDNTKTEALYFERILKLEVGHSFIPFFGKSAKYSGYTIYARNLGVVKYGNKMDEELIEWELVSIK